MTDGGRPEISDDFCYLISVIGHQSSVICHLRLRISTNRLEDYMSFQNIIYEMKDNVATVRLNRPDKMNSLNDDLADEVKEAMHKADDDKEVRVIVLTGEGRAFCAGGDITGFAKIVPEELPKKPSGPFDMNRRPSPSPLSP
jgi:hypothetical protein